MGRLSFPDGPSPNRIPRQEENSEIYSISIRVEANPCRIEADFPSEPRRLPPPNDGAQPALGLDSSTQKPAWAHSHSS